MFNCFRKIPQKIFKRSCPWRSTDWFRNFRRWKNIHWKVGKRKVDHWRNFEGRRKQERRRKKRESVVNRRKEYIQKLNELWRWRKILFWIGADIRGKEKRIEKWKPSDLKKIKPGQYQAEQKRKREKDLTSTKDEI